MDIINFYHFIKNVNILEKYDLPHTFFTEPIRIKEYNEERCLHEIIKIIIKYKVKFPKKDTSDLIEFVKDKDKNSFHYPKFKIKDKELIAPYINPYNDSANEPFIRLICFMKAYASHTFKYRGNFKDHFKNVFNIFYSMNNI
jgi:hypothetical protein